MIRMRSPSLDASKGATIHCSHPAWLPGPHFTHGRVLYGRRGNLTYP